MKNGKKTQTIINNDLINIESVNAKFYDYSRIEFRFLSRQEGGMDVDFYARNLVATKRRTFAIVVWRGMGSLDFLTYQAMFISLIASIIICICCIKITRIWLGACCAGNDDTENQRRGIEVMNRLRGRN